MVERPVRSVVKLMNIEDTSIIDDMKKVQEEVKIILKKQTPIPCEKSIIDESGKNCETESNTEGLDEMESQSEVEVKKSKVVRRKRKTELERLLDNRNFEISPGERRNAVKKHKFYAPTREEVKENLIFTNTVLAFNESKAVHTSKFCTPETGVTTAAILSGVVGLGGAGAVLGTGQGGQGGAGSVGDNINCCGKNDNCNHSVYLI